MVLPWIFYLEDVDEDVGDFEFIQTKVLAGDYFQVSGNINAINDTIEFVPATGKTAFMIEAKIVITGHPNAARQTNENFPDEVKADFIIDGTTKDTTNIGVRTQAADTTGSGGAPAASGYGTIGDGRFNVLGLSLVGNAVKKIEIKNTLDNGSAFATMSGYLV